MKQSKRVDGPDKATGRAVYLSDMTARFPGLLHLRVLRCPYAHARIMSLDVSHAVRQEGVVCVVTGQEPGVRWEQFPPQSRLAVEEAVWAGQGVAIVAATSPQAAEDALEKITVEYERLPHVLTWQEAFVPEPVSIVDPARPPRSSALEEFNWPNVSGEFHLQKGNCEEAEQQAGLVFAQGEFWSGKRTHNQLENAAAISAPQPDGGVTTWCNGCGVHGIVKKTLCACFPDVPVSGMRVISPYTGGSFGNRNVPYVEVLTVLMALKTKRPVYLRLSRREMFCAAPSNWVCATRVRLAANREGKLVSKQIRLLEEIGASVGNTAYTGRLSSSSTANVYAVEHVRLDTCAVLTNTVPTGPYRGLGTPEAVFGLELLMDELAEQLGISPLEIRLRNLIQKGGQDDYGEKITSTGLAKCLQQAADAIELEKPCEQDGTEWVRGKGIACCGKQNGPNGRSEAEVLLYHDGSVQLRVSCDNHGMGLTTSLAEIVGRELGVDPACVRIVIGDTDLTPYDNYSASSSGLYRTGGAVRLACKEVQRQLREAAARKVGVPVELVWVYGGKARIRGSAVEEIPVSELFEPLSYFVQDVWGLKQWTPVRGHAVFSAAQAVPWGPDGRTPRMWNWFQYAASAVEIAVNTKTGQIKVLRVANAGDTGNPISPQIIEGQLEGAAHMAIGFCLQEETLYDENGGVKNANLSDYRLPLSDDLPLCKDVKPLICPDPLPDGPYGAKGMSESVVSAIPAAIANALYRAVGVRVSSFPMTAEKILALLEAKEARK